MTARYEETAAEAQELEDLNRRVGDALNDSVRLSPRRGLPTSPFASILDPAPSDNLGDSPPRLI
jgi:hypothetical protein